MSRCRGRAYPLSNGTSEGSEPMHLTNKNHRNPRPGAIGPLTAVLLIPMVAMVAFAIDMSYIWRTEAELQNAADSAALAGAAELANAYYVSGLGSNSVDDKSLLLSTATTNAKYWAKYFGDKHLAGFEHTSADGWK